MNCRRESNKVRIILNADKTKQRLVQGDLARKKGKTGPSVRVMINLQAFERI